MLNVILCVIDDLGWRDLGCYGSSFHETPHLDALAARGLRFTQAYATSPLCTPSRASMLTGQTPARLGMTGLLHGSADQGRCAAVPYADHLPEGTRTLAHALGAHGYQTWHVGKWHLGEQGHWPEDHGFDVNIGGSHFGRQKPGYFSPWTLPNLENPPASGVDLTDYLTEKAIDLIQGRDPETPFFLNLWHYAVHDPLEAKAADIDYFREKARVTGLDRIDPFVLGEPYPSDRKRDRRIRRRIIQSDPVYAAMVYNLDRNVGRLWRFLEEAGLADSTLLLFTSDNGGLSSDGECPTCNYPLAEGKGWAQDGGVREPLLALGPGLAEPRVEDTPVSLCDLYPTILSLAGLPLEPEAHCEGESLAPLFTDPRGFTRGPLFFHYPHYSPQGDSPHGAIRDGDWKLIEHFEDDSLQLYHLRDDPGESRNLAEKAPERTRAMHDRLCAWRDRVQAILPQKRRRSEGRLESCS